MLNSNLISILIIEYKQAEKVRDTTVNFELQEFADMSMVTIELVLRSSCSENYVDAVLGLNSQDETIELQCA